MKYLLDTHIFLWLNSAPEKLPHTILEFCQQGSNQLYLSLVSPWEMQIKQQLGKLRLDDPLKDVIQTQIEKNNLKILPIELKHILALNDLPHIHKDPFDRLLIAQAKSESMILVTADKKIEQYDIRILS